MNIKKMAKTILPDNVIVKIKNIMNRRFTKRMLERHCTIRPFQEGKHKFGINLVGDIKAETGLGQSMRILASIMEKGNIPFCVIQVNSHGKLEHNDNTWNHKLVKTPHYNINVINIIPDTWAEDYCSMETDLLDCRYNIAYWPWELEEFPEKWRDCIETVNEIWTPSEFSSKSLRKITDKPVVTVPHIVEMKGELYEREHFHLPQNKFLYLTMYDFKSVSERKNPQAVISAYKQAFPIENKDVGLIIKVNHTDNKNDLEKLKEQLQKYDNIYYITRNLAREEVDSLIYVSDVFISLHRSEGFGLPLAEAMALGKPVISTNWSATTEFMDNGSACLVDYKLIEITKNVGPYEKGNRWADADIENAAGYMKKLWEDKAYCKTVGDNAKQYISQNLTYDHAVQIVWDRLEKFAIGE